MSDYRIQLEEFEGPLDLLLKLIEERSLDITTVSLSQVADQFIAYVSGAEEMNPGEVADFLVVASKLLLLKSRILMPSLELEEDEGSLERQLKIYREYYEAAKKIKAMIGKKNFMFTRSKAIRVFTPVFSPPKKLKAGELGAIF